MIAPIGPAHGEWPWEPKHTSEGALPHDVGEQKRDDRGRELLQVAIDVRPLGVRGGGGFGCGGRWCRRPLALVLWVTEQGGGIEEISTS